MKLLDCADALCGALLVALQLARSSVPSTTHSHTSSHASPNRPGPSPAPSSSTPLLATAILQLLPHLISLTTSQSLQTATSPASAHAFSSLHGAASQPYESGSAVTANGSTAGSANGSGSAITMYQGPTGAGSASLYGSVAAGAACAPAAPLASLAVVCQLLVEVVGEWLSPAEWVPLLRGAMQGPLLPGLEGGRQPVGAGRAAQVGPWHA